MEITREQISHSKAAPLFDMYIPQLDGSTGSNEVSIIYVNLILIKTFSANHVRKHLKNRKA
jgi:hypothetical protein